MFVLYRKPLARSELIQKFYCLEGEGCDDAWLCSCSFGNSASLFNDLANSNRNVAQRFIDSLKDFIAKVKSTFSGDKAKADTASQDKYGASVSELESAVAQFEKMLFVRNLQSQAET